VTGPGGHSWWNRGWPTHPLAAGIPAVALGCCEGEDMHAPTMRIRADSIGTGAEQLRAVLAEVLELTPGAARD
jgi:hypothetical protein